MTGDRRREGDRSRQRWRLFALAAGLLAAVSVLGYAWYVSDRIASGALDPPSRPHPRQLEVAAVRDEAIVLRDLGDSNLRRAGTWGLEWGHGASDYAQVGAVLAQDREPREVTRARVAGWPRPEVGVRARLDNSAFPDNPLSRQIAYSDVCYAGSLGETPAWFVPGKAAVWLIVVHGRGAGRTDALRLLSSAVDAELPTLVISYRNDPEAPGGASRQYRYGVDEWRDLEAAVVYARDHGAQGVVIAGYSMGAAIALAFMRESPLAIEVRALVLDSPMLDLRSTVRSNLESAGLPAFFVPLPMWIAAARNDLDWDQTDYRQEAAALRVPVLLFHGTGDETVPVELSDGLAAARPDIVEYHRVPGAHHVGSWNLDPRAYESETHDFLVQVVTGEAAGILEGQDCSRGRSRAGLSSSSGRGTPLGLPSVANEPSRVARLNRTGGSREGKMAAGQAVRCYLGPVRISTNRASNKRSLAAPRYR